MALLGLVPVWSRRCVCRLGNAKQSFITLFGLGDILAPIAILPISDEVLGDDNLYI